VTYRTRQLDVPHTLSAYFGSGYLNAALIADDSLIAYLLVLTTVALEVFGRTKNSLAEQPVSFRLQGAIVDCLWLGYLAIRPASNLFR
jgi:hypothetical protein